MPENSRVLRVVLLGAPNAGKSTLSNQLLGRKVCHIFDSPNPLPLFISPWIVIEGSKTSLGLLCFWQVFPVSKKVHTTRCQALGVITEKEAQVVSTCNRTKGEARRASLTIRPEENDVWIHSPERKEFPLPLGLE